MGSLTLPILAAIPAAPAFSPTLLTLLALTAIAVGMMGLLARLNGREAGSPAKQPATDLILAGVSIASHEPSLRSLTGRGAAAPSRAPPSQSHLVRQTVRLTVPPCFYVPALALRSDRGPIA